MTTRDLIRHRLQAQQLVSPKFSTPGEVVSWMGAVQAQDYSGALWSISQRLKQRLTASELEHAIINKQIVRTWPMRRTLHFVSPPDVRWMLRHLNPRIFSRMAGVFQKLGITQDILLRSKKLWIRALQGGSQMTRDELYRLLEAKKIDTKETRGMHILTHLAQEGLICFTPRRDGQHTFGLLDEWIPPYRILEKDEAHVELALRYFTSHGPATVEDFMWWAGLTKKEVAAALQSGHSKLALEKIKGREYWFSPQLQATSGSSCAWLLPTWDEYGISYKDRTAIVDPADYKITQSLFTSMIVRNGRAIGLWRRVMDKKRVRIEVKPFNRFGEQQRRAIEKEAQRYSRFVQKSLAPLEFK